jgi:CRISPR-associated protein Csb2
VEEGPVSLARAADTVWTKRGQTLLYSLSGGGIPGMRSLVRVSEGFRLAALTAYRVVAGDGRSVLISGHGRDGEPDRNHRHAFYLPQCDETERIINMYVVSPYECFSAIDLEALRLLRVINWNGPSTRVDVALVDEDDRSLEVVSRRWRSATPYVPLRQYYGTHGKKHLVPERQLIEELTKDCGEGGRILHCEKVQYSAVPVRLAAGTGAHGTKVGRLRQGFRVELECAAPICGPVMLGHSAHFGLGRFVPVVE